MKSNIVIKFNKEAIQSRTNVGLVLNPVVMQDNFLNQFTYRSIVTDEIVSPQKKINTVNFENLEGICYVKGLDNMPLDEKDSLVKKMVAYDFVEYAYVEPPFKLPVLPIHSKQGENPLYKTIDEIPDFTDLQGYKEGIEDDHIGIDMEYAWSKDITGQALSCAVVEAGFNYKHVNLERNSFVLLFGEGGEAHDHGTATSGIMYANDIGFGVKGLVHGADTFYAVDYLNNPDCPIGSPDFNGWEALYKSVLKLLQNLTAGDVVSISIGGAYGGPLDVNLGAWDILKEGLDAGIIICLAAGNSNLNLDTIENEWGSNWRDLPDIGVIHAGAGDKLLHKVDISSYGSMVHLQAWGEEVTTTGYGDLYNDGVNDYTSEFNGTSAASPIVASAAVAVQSWYKQQTDGEVLTPFEMRDLLIETGTPQSDQEHGKHIGPLPNVRNAIKALEQRLQLKSKS